MKKLNTGIVVTFDKQERNIKKLTSPYDSDTTINNPISLGDENKRILTDLFKSFNYGI